MIKQDTKQENTACDAGVTLTPLDRVLNARIRDYTEALSRAREIEAVPDADFLLLREAVEMVSVLRRMVKGRSIAEIHRAFGAPGDFGYDSPIGDALYRLYSSSSTGERGR